MADISRTVEGIDIQNDTLVVFREEKCKECFSLLDNEKVVLLRAPPYSGKTSFATLLKHYALDTKSYDSIHSISFLTLSKEEDVLKYLEKQLQTPFTKLFEDKCNILVILDETQMTYRYSDSEFWNILKNHMNAGTGPKNVHILLLAAYGESNSNNIQCEDYQGTPISFTNALSLEFLYFSEEELNEMVTKFNNTKYGKTSYISGTVSKFIYNITQGHIGLVRSTLQYIAEEFYSHSTTKQNDDKMITAFILSSKYYNKIDHTRAVPKQDIVSLSKDQEKVLMNVLNSISGRIPLSPARDLWLATQQLIKCGILNSDKNGMIGFPSRIIRSIQINRLFSSSGGETISTFEMFLEKTLSKIKPSILKYSKSASGNNMLYERQFQTEFYRCAIGLLGGSYGYCSPDVGHIFGANGFLDFYIDTDLKWGVELVRESDKLQEHSDRFKPGGKYKNIPMEEYAILNFVYKENLKGAKRLKVPCFQNEWLIFYDRVNPFLVIRRIGEETKHISLIGDEI